MQILHACIYCAVNISLSVKVLDLAILLVGASKNNANFSISKNFNLKITTNKKQKFVLFLSYKLYMYVILYSFFKIKVIFC